MEVMKSSDSEFTFVYKQIERDLGNHLREVILRGYGHLEHITHGVDRVQREVQLLCVLDQNHDTVIRKKSFPNHCCVAVTVLRTIILRGLATLEVVHDDVGEEPSAGLVLQDRVGGLRGQGSPLKHSIHGAS